MQRTVAKHRATFHTFAATDAERFVNRVFVIWVFDELPFDCAGGTKLIFGGGIKFIRLRFKVTGAELAVTAHIETVNAFHGGKFEYAFRRAPAALRTFPRINLPDGITGVGFSNYTGQHAAETDEARTAKNIAHEITPRHRFVSFHGNEQPLN